MYLERAVKDGHLAFGKKGAKTTITYVAVNRTEIFDDPEEHVRGEMWAELVYVYGYEPARIGVEVTVPDRTPKDAADLVVFSDDARTKPFAVIECKREGITDAEFTQAVEQAAGNGTWSKFRAAYVGVVAGTTRRFLDFSSKFGVLEREANVIADLPKTYGKPEEFKYHKNTGLDIRPVNKQTLIAVIKKSHQTLWGGGKLSPPAAFGELCKIIFVKISDEKRLRKNGEPYEFQIKSHESAGRLAERIKALYETESKKDPDVFGEPIRIGAGTLRTLVSHLEGINLSETDLDTKGVAFEQFMDSFFKGDFGQFFTPREIIDFAVRMMKPTSSDRVIDPACGSGGFLLYAMDAVRREADTYFKPGTPPHTKHWHDFAQKRVFGIEINDEIARVAKMNMIIHDDGHTNVICEDSLDRFKKFIDKNSGFKPATFDLVLTNPPFGSQILATERPYLGDYELGIQQTKGGGTQTRRAQKTEVLFIERVWTLLVPGTGRAAVVVPDGLLTNGSLQYVRDFITERFQWLAIVSLPPAAFAHYGAAVKSSIIFLRKLGDGETPDLANPIFLAAPRLIGYDSKGRECPNELPQVAADYQNFIVDPSPFLE